MAKRSPWRLSILIAFLFCIYIIPLATLLSQKDSTSNVEKRKLSPFPDIKWNIDSLESFPTAFNQYFSDHFGFRQNFIHVYNVYKKNVLQTTPVFGVVLGDKNWLYYFPPFSLEDLTGKMSPDTFTLDRWRKTLENRIDWFSRRGIRYYFLLAPNKQTIYPEYLPDWMQKAIAPSSRDLLNTYLKTHSNAELIDPTTSLLKNKEALSEDRQFNYYMRDSHWNSKGALVGAKIVIDRIRSDYPQQYLPSTLKIRQKSSKRVGDLTIMLDMKDSLTERLTEYRVFSPCAKPLGKPGGLKPFYARWVKLYACDKGKLTALIIHDSFGRHLDKYLKEYFKTTIDVSIINYEDMEYLIDRFNPDIVIDERVERSLRDALTPAKLINDDVYRQAIEDAAPNQIVISEDNLDKKVSCVNHMQMNRNGKLLNMTIKGEDSYICISAEKPAANESYLLYLDMLPALATNISILASTSLSTGDQAYLPVFQQSVYNLTRNHIYFELPTGMAANLRIHFGSYSNLFSVPSFKLVKLKNKKSLGYSGSDN